MRSITLSKSGINKLRIHVHELKSADFENSIKSLLPGEWCRIFGGAESYVGFINPMVEDKYPCAYVVTKLDVETDPSKIILNKIEEAISKRQLIKEYEVNARMFYGLSDGLPGLLIDSFANASIIQINTAGVDKYRSQIKEFIEGKLGTKAYFLDNPKYREKESLPTYAAEAYPELHVIENGLEFRIRPEVLQKVGFYYDHRENRRQLMELISRMVNRPEKSVDLFSYAGAWGMSSLKAGCGSATFVDQGDFEHEVNRALELNGFTGRGKFLRSDVFKFLDDVLKSGEHFDLVLCDPPAFAKSPLQKSQALEGYSKLHRKVLKIVRKGSIIAFSSCTHYVTHEEFQKNIIDASFKENIGLRLLYTGMQGFDHPVTSLSDKSNYIKSYFYIVE